MTTTTSATSFIPQNAGNNVSCYPLTNIAMTQNLFTSGQYVDNYRGFFRSVTLRYKLELNKDDMNPRYFHVFVIGPKPTAYGALNWSSSSGAELPPDLEEGVDYTVPLGGMMTQNVVINTQRWNIYYSRRHNMGTNFDEPYGFPLPVATVSLYNRVATSENPPITQDSLPALRPQYHSVSQLEQTGSVVLPLNTMLTARSRNKPDGTISDTPSWRYLPFPTNPAKRRYLVVFNNYNPASNDNRDYLEYSAQLRFLSPS